MHTYNTPVTITFDTIYDNIIEFKNNDLFDYYTVKLANYKPQDLYKSFISVFEGLFKDKFDIISISNRKALIYIDDTYIIISFDDDREYEDLEIQAEETILNLVKYENDDSAALFYKII